MSVGADLSKLHGCARHRKPAAKRHGVLSFVWATVGLILWLLLMSKGASLFEQLSVQLACFAIGQLCEINARLKERR